MNFSPHHFMSASTATADTPLRQAWMPVHRIQADRLATQSVDILFQVCLSSSRLPVPRHRRLTISPASTTVALIILRAVDLAWRLGGFATNRHEYCGLAVRLVNKCGDYSCGSPSVPDA